MKRHTSDRHSIPIAILLAALAGGLATPVYGVAATGGTVTNYVQNGINWAAHVFTSNGTITVINGGQIEYLIIGGGGGGGAVWQGGGGGGGGFLTGITNVTAGALEIVVGAGGKGINQPGGPSNGGSSYISNSVLGVILAYGGGYGGGESVVAANGGSGGGGSHASCTPGKTIADVRQGHDGGAGSNCDAGGGGGAGGPGQTPAEGRAGGPGRASSLCGGVTEVVYARGGNGRGRDGTDGVSKAANTGDGGDGSGVSGGGGSGGNGGSGIVIVRYRSFAMGNQPVTDVTPTTATFNGRLFSAGGEATSVCILWGAANGGDSWDWAHTEWFEGSQWTNNTPLSKKKAGLVKDKTYHYTFGAKNATGKTIADPPVAFITGEVTVKAAAPKAWEKGEDGVPVPAAITVSRPAACADAPLTVAYRLAGAAANGADYARLSGTVTLPAGAARADIEIAPWNDMLVEGDETATVILLPGPYIVGSPGAATMTIVDTVVRSFYVTPDAVPAPPYDTWAKGFTNLQDALDYPGAKGDAIIRLAGGRSLSGPPLGSIHPENTVFRWRGATNVLLLGGYRADTALPPGGHPGPRCEPTVLRRTTGAARVLTMSAVSNAVIEQVEIRDGRPESLRGLGGGVCLTGCRDVVFRNCSVVCNTNVHGFVGLGGGLYLADSSATLTDTTIATNRVYGPDSYGGGVYVHRDSRLTVTRSTIRANRADSSDGRTVRGGGYYALSGGRLDLEESVVEGNSPGSSEQ